MKHSTYSFLKSRKITAIIILILAVINFINMIVFRFAPIVIPLVNSLVYKLIVIAYIEEKTMYFLIAVFICIMLLMTPKSILRGRIILPIISLLLFFADLIHMSYLIYVSFKEVTLDNPITLYFTPTFIGDIIVVFLLVSYINQRSRN